MFNMLWSIKHSGEVLSKLKQEGSVQLVCPIMTFLLFIPHYPII